LAFDKPATRRSAREPDGSRIGPKAITVDFWRLTKRLDRALDRYSHTIERCSFYTYYRSQTSFRVRIALNLKGLPHDDFLLHLERGDQFAPGYRALNPQMVVPTVLDGDIKLFQSLAILEYLEETYLEPPPLPTDIAARAWVRGLALINIADSDPLIVPRIRHYLTDRGPDGESSARCAADWRRNRATSNLSGKNSTMRYAVSQRARKRADSHTQHNESRAKHHSCP
jgi:maleylacetoacetate isomerase